MPTAKRSARSALVPSSEHNERQTNRAHGGEGSRARVAPEAQHNDEVSQISSFLQRRQLPPPDMLPAARAVEPLVSATGPLGRHMTMSRSDRTWIYADIYGRQTPEREETDRRLAAVEHEIYRLPDEEKRAVLKAMSHNPLTLGSSPHVRLLLEDEDLDAACAARRLARYWSRRQEMFGADAFADGVFASPEYYDYLRFYEKAKRTLADRDADDTARNLAHDYIESVHRTKIAALNVLLENTPARDKVALTEAQLICPELTGDEAKLQFLRCEDFVESSAALRMVRYWKEKVGLFGPDKAYKTVKLEDLEDGGANLECGLIRLMPGPDEHGRSVLVIKFDKFLEIPWTEKCIGQTTWYVAHAALESESCRQEGIILLMDLSNASWEGFSQCANLRTVVRTVLFFASPLKFRALHGRGFHFSRWWQWVAIHSLRLIGAALFSRGIAHLGTDEEFWSEMERFGISEDVIPIELGGNVGPDHWERWIEGRKSAGL